jgi:hypothetical protein
VIWIKNMRFDQIINFTSQAMISERLTWIKYIR